MSVAVTLKLRLIGYNNFGAKTITRLVDIPKDQTDTDVTGSLLAEYPELEYVKADVVFVRA